jgi:hypothetical protein
MNRFFWKRPIRDEVIPSFKVTFHVATSFMGVTVREEEKRHPRGIC